jgi:hypothetical protein
VLAVIGGLEGFAVLVVVHLAGRVRGLERVLLVVHQLVVLPLLFEGEPVEIRRGGETPDHVRLGVQPRGLDGSEP